MSNIPRMPQIGIQEFQVSNGFSVFLYFCNWEEVWNDFESQIQGWVSPLEWNRAQKFKNANRHREFLTSRALIRKILSFEIARVSGLAISSDDLNGNPPPQAIPIQVSAEGKPESQESGRNFSFSHSGSYWAAVTGPMNFRKVGVDIQRYGELSPLKIESLWLRISSESERLRMASQLRNLAQAPTNSGVNEDLVLETWISKESISKAMGLGLQADFRKMDVQNCIAQGWKILPISSHFIERWPDSKIMGVCAIGPE